MTGLFSFLSKMDINVMTQTHFSLAWNILAYVSLYLCWAACPHLNLQFDALKHAFSPFCKDPTSNFGLLKISTSFYKQGFGIAV